MSSLIVTTLEPLGHSNNISLEMMKSCHRRNTQQQIHFSCFKQYGEYQTKVLSCIKPLVLFILNDLIFSHEIYQRLRLHRKYK